jgi:ribosome-associated heat shock protein Hsp15
MFKTRSAASKACSAGHVKIDGDSVKSSKAVKPGDQVEVLAPSGRRILDVIALADRRGPASVAQTLYVDQTPAPPPEMKYVQPLGGRRDRGSGRPTSYQRRKIAKLRGGDD